WTDASHRIIFHGRRVCHARTAACGACVLADDCPSAGEAGPLDPAAAARLVAGPERADLLELVGSGEVGWARRWGGGRGGGGRRGPGPGPRTAPRRGGRGGWTGGRRGAWGRAPGGWPCWTGWVWGGWGGGAGGVSIVALVAVVGVVVALLSTMGGDDDSGQTAG